MPTSNSAIIGTRGSLLARTQTNWLLGLLQQAYPDWTFETVTIRTTGDANLDPLIPQSLGKGLFTKEIESALISGEIDMAVHSLKDLPTDLPAGLMVGAIPERENPHDVLIGNLNPDTDSLETMSFGTSSLRRAAQLKVRFPGCKVIPFRGNLDTRIKKANEGVVDAAVVAAAGLHRLGRQDEIKLQLAVDDMLPAPAQGALAIEIREGDDRIADLVKTIHCDTSSICVQAERSFLHALGGGCRVPVAALATITGDSLELQGRVIAIDGSKMLEGTESGPTTESVSIGERLAQSLIELGADIILKESLTTSQENAFDV
jgi:hydroxymethylbilane synthase